MKDVNQLVFCRDQYESINKWREAISDAVLLLLDAGYIMTVRYDEPGLGIVAIDYNYDKREFGCDYPFWLSPLEFESVVWDKEREDEQ